MPCFSRRQPNQTPEQRNKEVKKAVTDVDKLLAQGRATIKVGPQGAITFVGIPNELRAGLTDVCIYNLLMGSGSESAKMAVQTAEMLAGRPVSQNAIRQGIHSHDGGQSWHPRG
jgi:hypothetical protein